MENEAPRHIVHLQTVQNLVRIASRHIDQRSRGIDAERGPNYQDLVGGSDVLRTPRS